MKNKAQVRIGYDRKRDQYVLYSRTDGEDWGFVLGVKCVRRAGGENAEEPEFIHFSIIEELKEYIANGYELVY